MQTKLPTAILFSVLLTLLLILFITGCQNNNSAKNETPSGTSKTTDFKKEKKTAPPNPQFNLEVDLNGKNKRIGQVKFSQADGSAKIVTLDVWVKGLEPNHQFLLQRAVDTVLDGNCTSQSWLSLGKGLQPQTIRTNKKGSGSEELWRDLSALITGARFDIHFRVVDAATLAVVLTSNCYQYKVR
jgi:hypothetical protein